MDDARLERRLFPTPPASGTSRPLPTWSEVHQELRRKGVTLALLWQEYKATHPEGLQYSRFCEQYRAWAAKLDVVMRQEHRAGERMFIDYPGQTASVVDPETCELRQAQVFAAVLGASSYTFAEATWTQTLPDWTASHVRAFAFYGGCPELVVYDCVSRNTIGVVCPFVICGPAPAWSRSRGRTWSARPHNGSQRSEPGQQGLVVAPNSISAG